ISLVLQAAKPFSANSSLAARRISSLLRSRMLDIGPIRFATRRPAGLAQNASTGLRLLSSQAMKAARSIDCLLVCIQFMWRSDTVFAALSVGAPGLPATAADQATAEAIVLC